MMGLIPTPTVGRKVWFFENSEQKEPWDATVIAVGDTQTDEPEQTPVTLLVVDPEGDSFAVKRVIHCENGKSDDPFFQWMPYQKAQHAKS